jgi:hypothetical protein
VHYFGPDVGCTKIYRVRFEVLTAAAAAIALMTEAAGTSETSVNFYQTK